MKVVIELCNMGRTCFHIDTALVLHSVVNGSDIVFEYKIYIFNLMNSKLRAWCS